MVATSENGPVTNRILLVEGQDDKHLVWQLCQRDELLFLAKRYGDGGYDFSVTLLAQSTTFRVLEKGSRIELLDAIRPGSTSSRASGCWNCGGCRQRLWKGLG